MQWILFAAVLLAPHAAAQKKLSPMLRFACSQLVVERIDPLVQPGKMYTPHLHQIVGGNSFNLTMDPINHDPAALSTCTSCSFVEDMSNYCKYMTQHQDQFDHVILKLCHVLWLIHYVRLAGRKIQDEENMITIAVSKEVYVCANHSL